METEGGREVAEELVAAPREWPAGSVGVEGWAAAAMD